MIYTCAAYSQEDLWCSEKCVKLSRQCLNLLLTFRNENSLKILIQRFMKDLLTKLRKVLIKGESGEEWRKHPESPNILNFGVLCTL